MLYIMAKDNAGARGVAQRIGLEPTQWKYLDGWRDVAGVRYPLVLVTDNAYQRSGHGERMDILRVQQATIFQEQDYARSR